jgi:hypothetical protein
MLQILKRPLWRDMHVYLSYRHCENVSRNVPAVLLRPCTRMLVQCLVTGHDYSLPCLFFL